MTVFITVSAIAGFISYLGILATETIITNRRQ